MSDRYFSPQPRAARAGDWLPLVALALAIAVVLAVTLVRLPAAALSWFAATVGVVAAFVGVVFGAAGRAERARKPGRRS
jgi:hypothetical protein